MTMIVVEATPTDDCIHTVRMQYECYVHGRHRNMCPPL